MEVSILTLHEILNYGAAKITMQFPDKHRMEVDVSGKSVTFVECRLPWYEKSGSEWTRCGVAQMKFDDVADEWTLHWADRNGRRDVFEFINPDSIDKILNEVELDQTDK